MHYYGSVRDHLHPPSADPGFDTALADAQADAELRARFAEGFRASKRGNLCRRLHNRILVTIFLKRGRWGWCIRWPLQSVSFSRLRFDDYDAALDDAFLVLRPVLGYLAEGAPK